MGEQKRTDRGIPLNQQLLWKYTVNKEDKLRLVWFKKNEQRLDEIANKIYLRKVPEEVKEENKQRMLAYFADIKHQQAVVHEEEPPVIDEGALHNIMRPVDKQVRNLLYASTINEGSKNYLRERYKLLPEERYYFPECTSFKYGWKTGDLTKLKKGNPFARQQVIKTSFYRRRGVERDPEWYKEPARLSPTVCGTT